MSQACKNFYRWLSVDGRLSNQLLAQGHLAERTVTHTRDELSLMNQVAVSSFFAVEKPDQVNLGATKVGAIYANNTYPAEPIYQINKMCADVVRAAFQNGAQKNLFLVPSCIYHLQLSQLNLKDLML